MSDIEYFRTVGRLLLGGAFVYAAWRNTRNYAVVAGTMSARGVPAARFTLALGIVVQCGAGSLFAFGHLVQPSAVALAIFVLLATPMFHDFWNHAQGPARSTKINGWVSNSALFGAFLLAAAGQS